MTIISALKKPILAALLLGGLGGIAVALTAEQVDHLTSSDEFCTSCHAMQAYIADDEAYKNSTHQTTTTGVRPGCADCHIPKGLVAATFTHVVNGVSDLWGEARYDYTDPAVWKAQLARLAFSARMWMRDNDSVTCRTCHEEASIKPQRKRGQRQHKEARASGLTCIDCHYNLVHREIEPSAEFLKAIAGE